MTPQRPDFDDDMERLSYDLAQLNRRVTDLEDGGVHDLRGRVNALEAVVERLQATASGPELSKREKHEAVIAAAQNKAGGPHGTSLEYGEVMAAANVSRRYAYTLMETVAAEYAWAEYDTSKQKNRLIIEPPDGEWDSVAVHNNQLGD